MTIKPMFTSEWETVKQIKDRTGHPTPVIHRAVRAAIAAKIVTSRLVGDEYLKIPEFRAKA